MLGVAVDLQSRRASRVPVPRMLARMGLRAPGVAGAVAEWGVLAVLAAWLTACLRMSLHMEFNRSTGSARTCGLRAAYGECPLFCTKKRTDTKSTDPRQFHAQARGHGLCVWLHK